ncbi:MAG: methyltransferase domain-containing protein [Patescibacteria group bacterium]|nr:methyltransferase domain-containing protein [Patescibacteria group bacterium]
MVTLKVKDRAIAVARNELMVQAIKAKCAFLFMLGDDVLAPNTAIITLLQRLWDNPDIDLVTGMYWTKSWPTQPYIWKGVQRGPYLDWKHGEFMAIDFAGCDCLLIRLSDRIKALGPNWFATDWLWTDDQQTIAPLMTEDFYFYTRAREAGIKLYCDTNVQCLHEDRTSGHMFGLTMEMPQHTNGRAAALPDVGDRKVRIADIGAGNDTPFLGHYDQVEIVRFDGNAAVNPDFRCDLRQLPAEDQSFDVIQTRHVLEHFQIAEAPKVLREWLRILRVGGEVRIAVPNLLEACRRIIAIEKDEEPPDHYPWWQLYGRQDDERDLHHNGFTPRKLAKLLELAGLEDIDIKPGETDPYNLYATAKKVSHPQSWALTEHWLNADGATQEGLTVEAEALVPTPIAQVGGSAA